MGGGVIFLFWGSDSILSLQRVKHQEKGVYFVGGSFFFCFGGQIPYFHYKGSSTNRRGFTRRRGGHFFVLGVKFHIFITKGQAPIEGGMNIKKCRMKYNKLDSVP